MSATLAGHTALVTGAGRGAGQAIALALARAGARVVVVDLNPDATARTVAAISQAGGTARAETVDIANKMAVQTMLYDVLESWERLDLLVNAAHLRPTSPALKLDEWEWNRTLDVNLKGPFLVAQTAARAMQATGGGVIVNVIRPVEASSHAAVRAARAGLLGLSLALANEWRGLGVSVVSVEASDDDAETAAAVLRRCRGGAD